MSAAVGWQEIPLAQMDLEDRFLGVSFPLGDLSRLVASLKEVGLLNPPWLRPRSGGVWQVVSGCKRVLAAAQLGWERLPARTLSPEAPEAHCLLIHLFDNAFSRGFNPGEQALLAARLLEHRDRGEVVNRHLPYLGLPPSPRVLDRLLALAALEPPFLRLAGRGRLALTAAAQLVAWGSEDRAGALPFLEGLSLSQSKQEELLEQVSLLARREGATPAAILRRPELQRVLADESCNSQEKTATVRRLLRRWVYPRFSAAEEAWRAGLGRLGLKNHPRLRLHPPPAFEGPDFLLEIKFRDAPELQQLLEEITRLAQQKDFSSLTRM